MANPISCIFFFFFRCKQQLYNNYWQRRGLAEENARGIHIYFQIMWYRYPFIVIPIPKDISIIVWCILEAEVTCLLLLIPDPRKLDACFYCSVSAGVYGPDGFLPEVYRPPHYRPHYLPHWSVSDRCSSRYQPIPLGDRHAVSNRTVIMCNCHK